MDTDALTDQEVVARAREGRERAYRELLDRYQRPVFSLIVRMIGDREHAEDLAQETFVKVLNALDQYDPDYKFSSWIFKIANNHAIDWLRRKRPETISIDGSPYAKDDEERGASGYTPVSEGETPEQYAESRELGRELERAIGALRPEWRSVIVLRHVEGRPYAEIADIVDLPLGTVKTYIHRARKQLREDLAHLRR